MAFKYHSILFSQIWFFLYFIEIKIKFRNVIEFIDTAPPILFIEILIE